MMLICGHLLEVVLGFIGQMGNAGADIVVDAGCRPAVIFLTLRKIFFGRLRVVYGGRADTEHSRWFGRSPDRNNSSSISW